MTDRTRQWSQPRPPLGTESLSPSHGPSLRLTYKRNGKTITDALPIPAAVREAQRETAEFRHFRELSRELVEVSEQVCRSRPVEDTLTAQEKRRPKQSARKSRAK